MKTDVFSHKSYVSFLKSALPSKGPERGSRRRLAEAIGCQPGFISLVLAGKSQLSLEAAVITSTFLKLDPKEMQFFLLLVQKDRAGSQALEKYFEEQLREILVKREEIKNRILVSKNLNLKEMSIYYECWIHAAVHMCCLIPKFNSEIAMVKYLGLQPEIVHNSVNKLIDLGLLVRKSGHLFSGNNRLHLGESNSSLKQHHTNWRLRAIESLNSRDPGDLHYTSIMSISEESARKIRKRLLSFIQEIEPIIKEAKDERVYSLNLDLFSLGK